MPAAYRGFSLHTSLLPFGIPSAGEAKPAMNGPIHRLAAEYGDYKRKKLLTSSCNEKLATNCEHLMCAKVPIPPSLPWM
jgi:hypothetical protein